MDALAAATHDGSLKLPDLADHCEDNDEFDYVWDLMDFGYVVNVANRDKHFPQCKVRQSEMQQRGVRCSGANRSDINMQDENIVKAYTGETEKAKLTFQNGIVSLPILAVARVADNHDALFTRLGLRVGGWGLGLGLELGVES